MEHDNSRKMFVQIIFGVCCVISICSVIEYGVYDSLIGVSPPLQEPRNVIARLRSYREVAEN